ncbi:hypothetical protein LCGC14_3017840 [marine sediment metagenome]|uniref:Uncharacterized protein n=1 Tax=marine sediment metagenome TaxID=412755 RepID=A0A0F8WWP4_9ZZZZ
MAITTNAELKTAIANWLERDDLTSRIPEFISLTEDNIGRELRVRAMETSVNLTVSSQETALPTGFVQQRRLYRDNDASRLEFFPPEDFWIRNAKSETGTPKLYTIEGDNLVVGPSPDVSQTFKLLYFKKFTALSDDSDTNWIFTNARGLYLFGTLIELSMYHEDEVGAIKWSVRWDNLLEKVHTANVKDRFPLGSLQMRSDVRGLSELKS